MQNLSKSLAFAVLVLAAPLLVSAQVPSPIPVRLGDTAIGSESRAFYPVRMKADPLGNKLLVSIENWNGRSGHEFVLRIVKLDPTATNKIYPDVLIDEPGFVYADIAVAADGTTYVLHGSMISKITPTGFLTLGWASAGIAGRSIDIDSQGNLYVGGESNGDAAWTKVNSSGNTILTKLLSGSALDYVNDLVLSPNGATVTIVGRTDSLDLQTLAAFQLTTGGGTDAFIARFGTTSGVLLSSTYLGGSGFDEAHGLRVRSNGDIGVVGETDSPNFPIIGAIQPTIAGGRDAFVTRMNPTGSALIYSTYLGGTGNEQALALDVDATGNTTIAGVTFSTNFPLVRSATTVREGNWQAFLSRMDPTGSFFHFSTLQSGGPNNFFAGFDIIDDSLAGLFMAANVNQYLSGGQSYCEVRRFSSYQSIPLFDTGKPFKPNPQIQVQIQDLQGINQSSVVVVVTAGYVSPRGNPTVVLKTLGGNFTFDRNLQYGQSTKGGYKYTLDRTGLPAGDYDLIFQVAGQSGSWSVAFSLK